MAKANVFKKGQKVKFKIKSRTKTSNGTGSVRKFKPGPTGTRVEVIDSAGRVWSPYVSQCSAA